MLSKSKELPLKFFVLLIVFVCSCLCMRAPTCISTCVPPLVLVPQGSPADGPRGLSLGDIVTGLEDCTVKGVEDWTNCLSHLSYTPQTGYCVPAASLQPSWAHGRGGRKGPGYFRHSPFNSEIPRRLFRFRLGHLPFELSNCGHVYLQCMILLCHSLPCRMGGTSAATVSIHIISHSHENSYLW